MMRTTFSSWVPKKQMTSQPSSKAQPRRNSNQILHLVLLWNGVLRIILMPRRLGGRCCLFIYCRMTQDGSIPGILSWVIWVRIWVRIPAYLLPYMCLMRYRMELIKYSNTFSVTITTWLTVWKRPQSSSAIKPWKRLLKPQDNPSE